MENLTPTWHNGTYQRTKDDYGVLSQQNTSTSSTMPQAYHQQGDPVSRESQGSGEYRTNVPFNPDAHRGTSSDAAPTSNANQSGPASQWLQNTVANELANNQALANTQPPALAESISSHSPPTSSHSDPHETQGNREPTYQDYYSTQFHPHGTIADTMTSIVSPSTGNGHHMEHSDARTNYYDDDLGEFLCYFTIWRSLVLYIWLAYKYSLTGRGQNVDQQWYPPPEPVQSHSSVHGLDTKSQALTAVIPMQELEEDDYYDVESDEENMSTEQGLPHDPQTSLGLMVALSASKDDYAMRTYHTFLHRPDILTNYAPRYTASPLMDPTTARIFAHFITATAPGLSSFNRHPVDPAIIFSGRSVPKSQQALWTYTLPMMALSNQCLLQAMLALASLQIARLQQAPLTTPMKHYHYALRRVARAVATPSKRTNIATIAATLILGNFEAMAAEHTKWSSHLAGARQLLMEVDFKGTTKRIREEKARVSTGISDVWYSSYVDTQFQPFGDGMPFVPNSDGLDENLIGELMGWTVNHDQYGGIIDETSSGPKPSLTEKEIEDYQIYRDLFWFYCKLDVIQSVIRGTELLSVRHAVLYNFR